jgi:hypothetical protein
MVNGSLDKYEYGLTSLQMTLSSQMILRKEVRREALQFIEFLPLISQNIHSTQRSTSNETTAQRICEQISDGYADFESDDFKDMMKEFVKLMVDYGYETIGTEGLVTLSEVLFAFR